MQTFIDTETQQQWAFDDDVDVAKNSAGDYEFSAADGSQLTVPITLRPHVPAAPSAEERLAEARAIQAAKMSGACRATLLGGFASSVLGAEHYYPSQDIDQRNLQSAVSASMGADERWGTWVWCSDGVTWNFVEHTAAQVQLVNADWVEFRVGAQRRYAELVGKINAAQTISEVHSVRWE